MEKMSVTRALAELKRLDDRIQSGMSVDFIGVTVGKAAKQRMQTGSKTVDEVKRQLQSNMDSLDAMFAKRSALKAAIVKSNATTVVSLGGKQMTVAEAIEMKRSITNKQALLVVLRRQKLAADSSVQQLNEKLNAEIEQNMAAIYGSDKAKIDASAYDSVAVPKKDQKEAAVLDPLDLSVRITKLEEEISLVETELDFTLSEANAKTEIEV